MKNEFPSFQDFQNLSNIPKNELMQPPKTLVNKILDYANSDPEVKGGAASDNAKSDLIKTLK